MSLNQNQMNALEEMKDNRAINPKLLNAFLDDKGELNVFLRFAQEHEDLDICFRGNRKAIDILYLDHVICQLTTGRKGYKVLFNFCHSKGIPDGHDYLVFLEEHGFKMLSDEKTICLEKERFTEEEINMELWQYFIKIHEWYYDPSKG